MHYFLEIVILLLIFNFIVGCIDIHLTRKRHLKLNKLDSKFTFKIKQQERFMVTLASKIAAFEMLARVKKVNNKEENKCQ